MTKFYLPKAFVAEQELAAYIVRLLRSRCQKIEAVVDGLGFDQPRAVENACQYPISIVCGPPGTGKTTTCRRIVDSFQKAGMKGAIACAFGKAAKRADEVINTGRTERVPSSTIHRLLQCTKNGVFAINRHNQLKLDYLLVDEFSTPDCFLARDLLSSVNPRTTRIVFSGDWHQLPSVGPGGFARDLIMSDVIPKTELAHIFRQGANSGIAFNAQRILNGDEIVCLDPRNGEKFKDFYFVAQKDENDTIKYIVDAVLHKMPEKRGYDPIADIQIMSPGKKSVVGTTNINSLIRAEVNPTGTEFRGIRVGDKVINRKNNFILDIVNGDIGIVKDIVDKTLIIDFGFGNIELKGEDIDNIYHAYGLTVHSCQGSEFKVSVLPIHKCHARLLFRNLVYTGITRSRELTLVVGSPSAFNSAIINNSPASRMTNLQSIIKDMAAKKSPIPV